MYSWSLECEGGLSYGINKGEQAYQNEEYMYSFRIIALGTRWKFLTM